MTAVALLAACGTDAPDAAGPDQATEAAELEARDRGWVGPVEGTDAFAAVVAGGGSVVVYVCDGDADIAEWFAGRTDDDGGFSLDSSSGATIHGQQSADRITGTVDLGDGMRRSFALRRAEGPAGLYRVEGGDAAGDGVAAGWIVDNDGAQRGSLRVRSVARAAPDLPASTLDLDGRHHPIVVYAVPARPRAAPGAPPPVPIPYPHGNREPPK